MNFALYAYCIMAYTGLTLVLGLLPRAEMRWWLLHPRALVMVPITGLLVGAPLMLLFLIPFETAHYLGFLAEDSIVPGALVLWTAGTIWLRIDQYVQERGKWSTTKRWTQRAAARLTAVLAWARRLLLRRRPMDAAGLSNWRKRAWAPRTPALVHPADDAAITAPPSADVTPRQPETVRATQPGRGRKGRGV